MVSVEGPMLERGTVSGAPGKLTITELYRVKGVEDPVDALDATDGVTSLAIPPYMALYRVGVPSYVQDKSVDVVEAGDSWDVSVVYSPIEQGDTPPLNVTTYEWDMGAETANVKSVEKATDQTTFNKDNPGGANSQTAIGISSDGSIAGVDIFIPAINVTIRKSLPPATVNGAFKRAVADLTASTNENTVTIDDVAFQPGEVLFLGPQFTAVDFERTEVVFRFAARKNESGIQFTLADGTVVTVPKKGWEYLWVEDLPKEDGANLFTLIKSVNVARVYRSEDWTALGL